MNDGTTTWNYTYDANGMRTSRTNSTTTYNYVYNGSQLVQMTVGSNTLNFAYDASGMPMTVTYNGTNYYYITNLQGDVMGIVDSTGTIVVNYTYDAWGKPLSITGTMADTLGTLNPLRYRGYVYDTETGYYYLQSRYYDPEIGRFINTDAFVATGQGFIGNNMFAYCLNNPVCCVDYTGHLAATATATVFGISNAWNPAGWAVLGVVGIVVFATIAYDLTRTTSKVVSKTKVLADVKVNDRRKKAISTSVYK